MSALKRIRRNTDRICLPDTRYANTIPNRVETHFLGFMAVVSSGILGTFLIKLPDKMLAIKTPMYKISSESPISILIISMVS